MLKIINLSGKSCTLDRLDDFLDDFMKTEHVDIEIILYESVAEFIIRGRSGGYSYGICASMLTDELIRRSTEKVGDYIIGLWNSYDHNETRTNYDFLKDRIDDEMLATLFSMDVYVNICKFCPAYDYKVQCDCKCDKHFKEWLNKPVNYDECVELIKYLNEKENVNEL